MQTLTNHELLTIGELSARSGQTRPTLRYYESLGLIVAAKRTSANYRLFEALPTLKQLGFIRKAQQVNFSLEEIRHLLALSHTVHPCTSVRGLLTEKLAEIRIKIGDLKSTELFLSSVQDKWSQMPDCDQKIAGEEELCSLISSV